MIRYVLCAAALVLAANANAADTSCVQAAKDKKLSGAAYNSFVKKCEATARNTCETRAKEKKLAGAAQTSFMKKCVAEAIGSQ